jgi:integrase/recombinase XerD
MKMPASSPLVGTLLQTFFTDHLLTHKRVSPQTVASYRDAFRLLLQFAYKRKGIAPAALRVSDLDVPTILAFLDSLERERHNCVRSRNIRLAAIRSFFRLVALKEPACVGLVAQVLALPVKRTDRHLVAALTREEAEALLAAPDLQTWQGRRDHALLLTLYNSGARVSELTALQCHQVHFGACSFLQLSGKGRKERSVPLWPKTARTLKAWFAELAAKPMSPAFPSARGRPLTRNGVDYLLQQAVCRAALHCPSLRSKRISPHTWRHTTATHLLQSGVDISVIALWLGHESTETTHVYIEADLATKESALEKLAPAGKTVPRFKATDPLLAFLATL